MQDQPGKGIRGKLGTAEALAVFDIGVEPGIAEVGAKKVYTPEIRAVEIGTGEVGIAEEDAVEVGIIEIGTGEVGVPELGALTGTTFSVQPQLMLL